MRDNTQHLYNNFELRKLLIPIIVEQLLSSLMGTADTMMVSNVGSAAISAVSLVDSINILVIQALSALSAGGAILCSQYLGSQNKKDANRSARQVLFVMVILSVALSAFCLIFRDPLLHVIFGKVERDVMTNSQIYFFFTLLSFPFIGLYDAGASIMRSQNNSRNPMIISVISNFMNIGGNAILIFGRGMGVEGAAISTLISRIFCAVVVIWQLRNDNEPICIRNYFSIRPDWDLIKRILLIGIPASITNLMQSFAVLLTNRFLLPYGSDKVAALGIALKVNMITMLILVGFAFGAQPLLGYCYGADNRERLKQFLHFDLLVQLLIALVFTAAACIFAPHIIRIFMQDDVIVASGALMLRCLMITAPVIGMILVFTTLFQAAGMALPAFLMSISRQGVLLVLCMLLFSSLFGYMGILLAQAVSDVLTGILGFLLLRRSKILL